jgi:hypothetical protein
VRRILLGAALIAGVTGCEASTDPIDGIGGDPPGGGAVTQAQATGDWTFTLDRTTTLSCSGGSLPDNQVLIAHLDVLNTGGLSTATSNWRASPSATIRPLEGVIRFTDGFGNLTLFGSTAQTTGMELRGTFTAAGGFSGTVTDPDAGLTSPFGGGGCEYLATGVRTG